MRAFRPMTATQKKPIKVVHVITRMILGGAQENTLITVKMLAARPQEYKVVLCTGLTIGREGELLEELKRVGIEWYLYPQLKREIAPVDDVVALYKLIRFFYKFKPDIVHTHSSKAGILGRVAAWVTRVPVIIHTIHGLPFDSYQRPLWNKFYVFLETICAWMSSSLITVSGEMKERAIQAGVAGEEKFVTIYSGMDVELFSQTRNVTYLKKQLGIGPEDIVLGVVSRLAPFKGHQYLLNIAPAIIRQYPNVKFLFVGDGALRNELEEEAQKKQILPYIIFAGLVSHEKIPEYIQVMHCVIHPSLREGLARVIPQAILSNRPVISFEIGGAKEVVIPGKTGYLVSPGDEKALLAAILKLLSEKGLPNPLTVPERESLATKFRGETMVARIEQVYQTWLSKRAKNCEIFQTL